MEQLGNLIGIFQNPDLNFAKNRAENDDILGDAYEYLMRHFATESGKSKGQFYPRLWYANLCAVTTWTAHRSLRTVKAMNVSSATAAATQRARGPLSFAITAIAVI